MIDVESSTSYSSSSGHVAAASAVGLTMGVIAGWGIEFGGIFTVFLALVYGVLTGEAILRAGGRMCRRTMEIVTAICMVAGALGGRLLIGWIQLTSTAYIHPPLGVFSVVADLVMPTPIPLVSLIIAIIAAVIKIRLSPAN
ncbi:MAG: hypothetical protein ABFD49_12020 [Armatimonadota bacterium]|nr:hypothetical protein [bacterium]